MCVLVVKQSGVVFAGVPVVVYVALSFSLDNWHSYTMLNQHTLVNRAGMTKVIFACHVF